MLTNALLSANPVWLAVIIFADFADLPIRAAWAVMPVTVPAGLAGAGPEAAGFTFECVDENVLSLEPIEQSRGGGGAVRFRLRVDPASTPELLTAIDTPAIYDGRAVNIWVVVHDDQGVALGIETKRRGYMVQPVQNLSRDTIEVVMEAETWLAVANAGPHGGTYLNWQRVDPDDRSAEVTLGQGQQAPTVPYGGGRGIVPGLDTRVP